MASTTELTKQEKKFFLEDKTFAITQSDKKTKRKEIKRIKKAYVTYQIPLSEKMLVVHLKEKKRKGHYEITE